MQESYERPGDENSLFTKMLVDGIISGYADTDNDGYISVDDAYTYAYKAVVATGLQHPTRFNLDITGELLLAYNQRYSPEEHPSIEKVSIGSTQAHAAVEQMPLTCQKSAAARYFVSLGGYRIEGFPYPATGLTVDAETTPNARLTLDGFECDTWFEPNRIQPRTVQGKEIYTRPDGIKIVKVRLKVFFKDIWNIAVARGTQGISLYTDPAGMNKMIEFMQMTDRFFEQVSR